MEDIARLADRVLVLQQGRVQACGTPMQVFQDDKVLAEAGLSMPRTTAFLREMAKTMPNLCTDFYTPAAAAQELIRCQISGKGV